MPTALAHLQLLQLADSAVPIGATAHSYGLEMLVADGDLTVERLPAYLDDHLTESAHAEAVFCCAAHRGDPAWSELNALATAWRTPRESRTASLALGRRFLQLASNLIGEPLAHSSEAHFCTSFGLVGRTLGLDEVATVQTYLHQSLAGLVSACQRLLPLGQQRAAEILWDVKPAILITAARAADTPFAELSSFSPLPDLGSLRHPDLTTRLFIS